MTKLALLPLLAIAGLKELTQYGFGIYAKGYLLDLNGFEEFGGFSFCLLGGGLFFFALGLFGVLALLFWGFGGGSLGLDYGDLFLGLATLFLHQSSSQMR